MLSLSVALLPRTSIPHLAPNNMSREHYFVLMQYTSTRYLEVFMVHMHNVPAATDLEEFNDVQGKPPVCYKKSANTSTKISDAILLSM